MPDKFLLDEKATSDRFGIAVGALQQDRAREQRIPFVKLGRRVFYNPQAVEAALLALTLGGVKRPGPPRRKRTRRVGVTIPAEAVGMP